MTDNPQLQKLLDELFDSQATPEQVCASCPEMLPEVCRRWEDMRRIQAELDALFPTSSAQDSSQPGFPFQDNALPVIPGYIVESVLGYGGMGIVYRAYHLRLHRPVALKMLLARGHALRTDRERFEREAEAVAALRHPNIVQIYDIGDVNGQPFFTMEFVEGDSMAKALEGTPQPARQAAALVALLADAIHAAHQCGIVHRDLKPGNVLLTTDGTPKVTDFGLAWRVKGGTELTLSGVPVGTPSYMSPCQARGDQSAMGPATDIWALGAILYEMLVGRPPFHADTASATLHLVVSQEPVPVRRLNPRVPRDLQTICLKCLHKEPHRRYANAQALAEDLRRFERGVPIKARPVGPVEHAVRWVRRQPALAGALGLGILLASALICTVVWWHGQRAALSATAIAYAEADLSESERLRNCGELGAAAAVLQRAKDRLGEYVSPGLRNRLRTAVDNLELVSRLDAIRLERALTKPTDNPLAVLAPPVAEASQVGDESHSGRHYEDAFRDAGIGAPGDDPVETAARIQASPVRSALVGALDDWAACAADHDQQVWVLAVVRQADPGPWRDRVRDPASWNDPASLRELADSAPIADHSPQLLAVMGARLRAQRLNTVDFLERVASAHPGDFWVNVEMGNALCDQARADEAIGYYRTALALRPEMTSLRLVLGDLYLDKRRWDGAVTEYEQAIRLDPENPSLHNRLGFTLAWKGDPDEAIVQFREAIRIDANNGWSHFFLAIALENNGRLDEAADEFREAARLLPEKRVEARQHWRRLLFHLGRDFEAQAAWKKELEARPPAHDEWFGFAELCLFLKLKDDYHSARLALLEQFGATTNPAVAERVGRACLPLPASEDELQQAAALTDRAVAVGRLGHESAYPYSLFAQGLARYRQGRFDDAIKLLTGEAAYVMGPCPRLILAMAQFQQGLQDEARESLAAAISSYDWNKSKADHHDAWIAHVLRRDAEALIQIDKPAVREDK